MDKTIWRIIIGVIGAFVAFMCTFLLLIFGIIAAIYTGLFDKYTTTPLYEKILFEILPVPVALLSLCSLISLLQKKRWVVISFIAMVIVTIGTTAFFAVSVVRFNKYDYVFDQTEREFIREKETEDQCCYTPEMFAGKRSINSMKVFTDCEYVVNGTVEIYENDCTDEYGFKACEANLNDMDYICPYAMISDRTYIIIVVVFHGILVGGDAILTIMLFLNLLDMCGFFEKMKDLCQKSPSSRYIYEKDDEPTVPMGSVQSSNAVDDDDVET